MYLRTTQRRNRDGSSVRYLQLAHNEPPRFLHLEPADSAESA